MSTADPPTTERQAAELVSTLAERGCVLWVEGEMLRFKAPDGVLTPPLMARLKRNKRALVQHLRNGSQAGAKKTHAQEPSFGQQAMWLLHQSAPTSAAYNVASAVRLTSTVDFAALQRVWRTLVTRHDALRTTFETAAGRLAARVHEEPLIDASRVDVAGDSDAQLAERVRRAYAEPFDLAKGPLARLKLFSSAPDRHVLLMSMHHIVLDAWSLWVLHDELGELYRQEAGGGVGVLPAVEANYGDFVRWQQAMPNTEAGRGQWDYWQEQLAGEPEPARLPWDRPRPSRSEQHGASLKFRLPADLAGGLRELGRRRGATPFVTLLAVYQTLLHRHSGQADFLVGTTTSGRSSKQFSRLVGYLVNTLPLRTTIKPGDRFTDLLEQSREATLGGMAAQDFPFPLMVERLNPPRESGALPLCRVMFGLQKPHDFSEAMQALDQAEGGEGGTIDWGGLDAAAFPLDQQEGQFDLTLEMYETPSTFLGVLKYDPALLDTQSAHSLTDRYEALARQVVADPDRPLEEYEIATAGERALLAEWSAPATDNGPEPRRLEQLFAEQAARDPHAPAVFEDETELSYRELDERTNQVAAWLRELGAKPGDAVGCCLARGAGAWVAHLACLKAGAVYVPLDDNGPTDRVCALLRDCDASLLLSDAETARRLDLAAAELPTRLELLDESADEIAALPAAPADSPGDGDGGADAYIIYTSGSTGVPKGVVVSHAAMAAHLARVRPVYGITDADRVLQFSAMTFDPSLEQAWSAWSAGATLVVRGPRLWSAAEFWSHAQRRGVTVANLPPAYFRECSDAMPDDGAGELRLMIVGGDAFPADSLAAWRGHPTRLLNAYGPTEAVVTATVAELSGADVADAEAAGGKPAPSSPPIGRPLPGTAAHVVDRHNRPQPIGVPGELLLSGAALASRYLNDASLTAQRFAALPSLTGDERPVYRTGDLVRWNHRGELEFLSRLDRQVKINGYRIELGEVERALEAVAGVEQAVAQVKACPDGEPRLVAHFVAQPGAETPTPQALIAAVRARLPHYMAPAAVLRVDAFPLNASGKVAVAKLPEIDASRACPSTEYAPPENELQRVLAEVWAEVLGVERVGIHDDFFELGGASLKSLQIVSAAEERGVRLADASLSPALLFEHPTVAQLAELLAPTTHLEAGVAT